jgi:3-methyladenine DNA glycosylase AlkD
VKKSSAKAATADLKELREEIIEALKAHQDPTYEKNLRKLVPTKGTVTGVRVPQIRALVKDFYARHKEHLSVERAAQLLDDFCRTRGREEVLFGVFLLAQYRRQFSPALWEKIDRWVECIDNWETCDQLAMNVAGELLITDISRLKDLVGWAKTENPWRRRFAAATTTALNQKGRSYPEETFRVCEPLLVDQEPTVQKAVAWAIREVAKNDEPAAFSFLTRNKKKAHPKILREASEKLTAPHRTEVLGK